MAMTDEERKIARREASKRWYAAHKANAGQAGKTPSAGPVVIKKAKLQATKHVASADTAVMKSVDRLIKTNVKAVNQMKNLMKDAAEVLTTVFASKNEKLISSVQKALAKNLCIRVDPETIEPAGRARKSFELSFGARLFRVPRQACPETDTEVQSEDILVPAENEETDTGPDDSEPKEIFVDPARLEDIESGSVTEAELDAESDDMSFSDDEEDTDDEDDDEDEDSLSDEELYERHRRRIDREAEAFQEDWSTGRAEMMRELGAQGFGEED